MNDMDVVRSKIYEIRGLKVMLDRDLAEMYGVETRVLNQAVKRNADRFPEDFMFQLSDEEWDNLKSQFVISRWGGIRKLPYAFTELGVAMLSSVLSRGTKKGKLTTSHLYNPVPLLRSRPGGVPGELVV